MVELVAMSEADFRRYLETAVEDYAQAHIKAGDCAPGEAQALAQADYDELLPRGLSSEGQHLFTVVSRETSAPVGMVWFALRQKGAKRSAYIYDIQVDAAHRGKGYGAEARRLYERAGFQVTGMGMAKQLTSP